MGRNSASPASGASSAQALLEQDPARRAWIARCLDRNDVELAALSRLHADLHALRAEIVARDGDEGGLLDAATKVNESERGLEDDSLFGYDDDSLVAGFFDRLRLRRRILNRLSRRCNRASRVADGETSGVDPPPPPKYGDARFVVPEKEVLDAFAKTQEEWEEAVAAKRRRTVEREERELRAAKELEEEQKKKEESSETKMDEGSSETKEETSNEEKSSDKDTEEDEEDEEEEKEDEKSRAGANEAKSNDELEDAPNEKDTEAAPAAEATADNENENENENDVSDEPPSTETSAAKNEGEKPPPSSSASDESAPTARENETETQPDRPLWPVERRVYVTNDDDDEKASKAEYAGGVGAVHRSMSHKEKAAEWRRWQDDLISRVPDQPTFAELGMNKIFHEAERRERLRRKQAKEAEAEAEAEGSSSDDEDEVENQTKKRTGKKKTKKDKGSIAEDDDDSSSSSSSSDDSSDDEEEEKVVKDRNTKAKEKDENELFSDDDDEEEEKVTKQQTKTEKKKEDDELFSEEEEEEEEKVAKKQKKKKPKKDEDELFSDDDSSSEDEVEKSNVQKAKKAQRDAAVDDSSSTNERKDAKKEAIDEEMPDADKAAADATDDESVDANQTNSKKDTSKKKANDSDDEEESTRDSKNGRKRKAEKDSQTEPPQEVTEKTDKSEEDASSIESSTKENKTPVSNSSPKQGEKTTTPTKTTSIENSVPKLKRPRFYSLQAVPSFHEQDLRRVRAVHADVVESTALAQSRRGLKEATAQYQRHHKASVDWSDLGAKLRAELARLRHSAARVGVVAGAPDASAVDAVLARERWRRRRDQWEDARRRRARSVVTGELRNRVVVEDTVSSVIDVLARAGGDARRVARTDTIGRSPWARAVDGDPTRETVSSVMTDMLDSVVFRAAAERYRLEDATRFEDLFPPPDNGADAVAAAEYRRREALIVKNVEAVRVKLAASEDDRRRSWRKVCKLRAESAGRDPAGRGGRRGGVPPAADQELPPIPALAGATTAATAVVAPAADAPSTPSRAPTTTRPSAIRPRPTTSSSSSTTNPSSSSPSSSKYSQESIRSRIYPDGSIKPVGKPRLTKDGLYQRPAGRKRKGMEWDPHRGVWTPAEVMAARAKKENAEKQEEEPSADAPPSAP